MTEARRFECGSQRSNPAFSGGEWATPPGDGAADWAYALFVAVTK